LSMRYGAQTPQQVSHRPLPRRMVVSDGAGDIGVH
jgi:hypothetical protein